MLSFAQSLLLFLCLLKTLGMVGMEQVSSYLPLPDVRIHLITENTAFQRNINTLHEWITLKKLEGFTNQHLSAHSIHYVQGARVKFIVSNRDQVSIKLLYYLLSGENVCAKSENHGWSQERLNEIDFGSRSESSSSAKRKLTIFFYYLSNAPTIPEVIRAKAAELIEAISNGLHSPEASEKKVGKIAQEILLTIKTQSSIAENGSIPWQVRYPLLGYAHYYLAIPIATILPMILPIPFWCGKKLFWLLRFLLNSIQSKFSKNSSKSNKYGDGTNSQPQKN